VYYVYLSISNTYDCLKKIADTSRDCIKIIKKNTLQTAAMIERFGDGRF